MKIMTTRTTKKALQEQIEQLQQEHQDLVLACKYLALDRDACKRERDGARAEVVLLREELAELRDQLGGEDE